MAGSGIFNIWMPKIIEANKLGTMEMRGPQKLISEEDLKNVDFTGTQIFSFFDEQPWGKFNANQPLYHEEQPKQ